MATPSSSDIHAGPGFRIRRNIERPTRELVEALAAFDTPDLCDLTNRLYAMGSAIIPLVGDGKLAGPACTVKVYPGDNLMVHSVLDIAQPGDVVVVDCCGGRTNAVLGDMILNKAYHRGIAGFVIDGLIRDVEGCQEVGLPVFAVGTTPAGPLHRGPGEVNYPVACGGVVVMPGDIVIGDSMGISVVPRTFGETLLERLEARRERMATYAENVRRGDFSMDWVNAELEAKGCLTEES